MVRRLPIYFVLDASLSMSGLPIEAVNDGLQCMVAHLRQDPEALETAFLSLITFGDQAKQVVPLVSLERFRPVLVAAGGQTNLGSALKLLAECVQREVRRSTAHGQGDYKPLIFLMTDGQPTDNWLDGLAELRKQQIGRFIACAVGPDADARVLKQIADSVVRIDAKESAAIRAFLDSVGDVAVRGISRDSDEIRFGDDGPVETWDTEDEDEDEDDVLPPPDIDLT